MTTGVDTWKPNRAFPLFRNTACNICFQTDIFYPDTWQLAKAESGNYFERRIWTRVHWQGLFNAKFSP